MIARTLVAVAAVALLTDTASAQFRPPFPYPQSMYQPPPYRPVPVFVPVGPGYSPYSAYPMTQGRSTAVGRVVDLETGAVTHFGTAADAYTGAVRQSASQYDPDTGATYTNNTFGNAYTGTAVNRQTYENPIAGKYISRTRVQRPEMSAPFGPPFPFFPR